MKRITAAAIIVLTAAGPAAALWEVADEGRWPDTWPEKLEPLRDQSRTLTGGLIERTVHEIPFTSREEFEAAWPHILAVKDAGAPVILLRPDGERFIGSFNAGVVIYTPPRTSRPQPAPLPGASDVRTGWLYRTYIELIVDGEIVDLNRIPLPADTPIVDERFEKVRETAIEVRE